MTTSFSLKSIMKSVLPAPVWRRIKSIRDRGLVYVDALQRARASIIEFHSGLADSSAVLYGLVRSMKPQVCVEIGSARGNSSCAIGAALKENGSGKLYAIDPHRPTDWNDTSSVDTFDIIRRNIATLGLKNQVEIIRSLSDEAARDWTRPIDLIFIDGDHSYEGVKQDWNLFVKHVTRFGLVIFHDTIWDIKPSAAYERNATMGVPRFVDELRQQGYQVITLDKDCGVSIVQPVIGGIALH
jgi:predicted O-methyltransferase YrrM